MKIEDVAVTALSSLIQNEKLPEQDTVMGALCHVLYHTIGSYLSAGNSEISQSVGKLIENCFNTEDEAIASLGIMDRQMVWAALSALRKKREIEIAKQLVTKEYAHE